MPNVTTPATAHDATQVLPVRIPEQFPASPRMIAATVANTEGTNAYGNIKGNVITFAAPLAAATTLNLTIENFHAGSNICVVRASATAAVRLSIALSDLSFSYVTLAASDDVIITSIICAQDDGSYELIVLSVVDNTVPL